MWRTSTPRSEPYEPLPTRTTPSISPRHPLVHLSALCVVVARRPPVPAGLATSAFPKLRTLESGGPFIHPPDRGASSLGPESRTTVSGHLV